MVKKKGKMPHDDWPPLLRRVALDSGQRPSRDAVQSLTDEDVRILRELVDQKRPAQDIRQDKALAVLAERAPDAETAKVLENVIGDTKRSASLRAVAAIGLGRIPPAISEEILLAHVTDENATVAQRAIQSLGKISGHEALEKLDAMAPPKNRHVLRQWQFSRRLIRHRLGVRGQEPPQIAGTVWATQGDTRPRPLPMEHIAPKRVREVIENLQDDAFGIELAEDRGYSFETDRSQQFLLIAQRLTTRNGLKQVGEVSMVAAVIAMWEPRTRKALLDQLVLTEPMDDGRVLIQGHRQDGTLLFEGRATVHAAVVDFTLVNTARAAQCRFKITGQLKAKQFVIQAETLPRLKTRRTRPLLGTVQ